MGRPDQSLNLYLRNSFCLCLVLALVTLADAQSATDAALNAVRINDRADRAANGKFAPQISAAEHMRRAGIYLANRAFAPAREHWQAVLDNYPNDVNVPAALFGMARSYYVERRYEDARHGYERDEREYPLTEQGREA